MTTDRTVLPEKFPKTVDDYVSMKFCTIGRFPVYGIYNRRDLDLVAVCVEGSMHVLDDCDLQASLVPDLKVCKVQLNIQDATPLASTKELICCAVSSLSLGYTPQKKKEWLMQLAYGGKGLSQTGGLILGLSSRWNKISKAIRRGQCSYVFTHYQDDGRQTTKYVRDDYLDRMQ